MARVIRGDATQEEGAHESEEGLTLNAVRPRAFWDGRERPSEEGLTLNAVRPRAFWDGRERPSEEGLTLNAVRPRAFWDGRERPRVPVATDAEAVWACSLLNRVGLNEYVFSLRSPRGTNNSD